jgi:hypothetical protein
MFLCGNYAKLDNSICVDTGEIKISPNKLYTGFVYSCSVLTFSFTDKSQTKNFLAHVDALGENMEIRLYDKMKDLPLNKVNNFSIYYGPLCKGSCKKQCRCKSMNIIRNVFLKLGLKNVKVSEYNLEVWQTEVSIPPEKFKNNGTTTLISSPERIFLDTPEGAFEGLNLTRSIPN